MKHSATFLLLRLAATLSLTAASNDQDYALSDLASGVPLISSKRGVVGNYMVGNLNDVKAAWYFTYSLTSQLQLKNYGVPWVPMVPFFDSPLPATASPHLLSYNKPDLAPFTPAQTLAFWPRIEAGAANSLLGSPTTASANLFSWLPQFLAGSGSYLPRVDFITVIWFGSDANAFLAFIDQAWSVFKKPIWVTEFAMVDSGASATNPSKFTSSDALAFIKIVIPGLESRSYVQRYSWYSDIQAPANAFSSLWNLDKTLTPLGKAYAGYSIPNAAPSSKPTLSLPSSAPSLNAPSARPSIKPFQRLPTAKPTPKPSSAKPIIRPSVKPFAKPTARPSAKPFTKPISIPSRQPSLRSPTATVPIPLKSTKRGMVGNNMAGDLNAVNAAWYYTYDINSQTQLKQYGVPWVPMIYSKDTVVPSPPPEYLLGFNEPDLYPEAPLTTLKSWPKVEAAAGSISKIGSPSTGQPNLLSWMSVFLAGTPTYKPRVDFIAVHWYGNDANAFLAFIDTAWAVLKKPIWVTEFALADWRATTANPSKLTPADAMVFLKIVIPGLESRPYVHRYSWYSDIRNPAHAFCSLWNLDKTLTPLGRAYAGYAV